MREDFMKIDLAILAEELRSAHYQLVLNAPTSQDITGVDDWPGDYGQLEKGCLYLADPASLTGPLPSETSFLFTSLPGVRLRLSQLQIVQNQPPCGDPPS
jgi:hypothetical protein